jgi:hypothetical protein
MLYINRVYRHTLPVHVIGFTAQLPTVLSLEVIQLEQAVLTPPPRKA